jgi:hypothetical protein
MSDKRAPGLDQFTHDTDVAIPQHGCRLFSTRKASKRHSVRPRPGGAGDALASAKFSPAMHLAHAKIKSFAAVAGEGHSGLSTLAA